MDVAINGVSKRFGDVVAVDDVTLRLSGVTAVVGPSGSGKSTLLNLVAGLDAPTTGAIAFDGRDVSRVRTEDRDLGYVFQSYALFPHLTVEENVGFGRRAAARDLMERFRIAHLAKRRPRELSGGEKQRVAVARALARDPRLLLLDEPLAALDAQLRDTIRHELARLFHAAERTTIYVTHDRAEAMTVADTIVVMRAGRVEQVGTPAAIYQEPANRFVASFFGDANFVRGRVSADGRHVELFDATVAAGTVARRPGAEVDIVVRPESFALANGSAPLRLRIDAAAFLGNRWRLEGSDAHGNAFVIELPPDARVAIGDSIALAIRGESVHVIDA